MESKKRLYRSTEEKMISGVCGGIAEYFDIDPTIVRIVYVFGSIISVAFPGIFAYLLLALIIPKKENKEV